MKKVNTISTVVQRKISGEKIPTGNNVTLNGVVDIDEIRKELSKNFISFDDFKSYWEIKTDAYGNKYIYSSLHIATQNGITMYAGKDGVNIPSIYDGLPIDSQTIYWEDIKDDNGVVVGKILKAKTGGGTLGSLTNVGEWADSVASVDRIMVQKQGSDKWVAMDASKLGTSASFENIFETGEGNAYTSFTLSDDKKSLSLVKGQTFITASESEDITGIKNFINGLQINGVELKYDSTNNAVFIQKSDGSPVNFYSTGGISMYGQGNTSVKTIMDAITANLDTNTLAIKNGLLTVVGGTGGIESITKQMVIDALGFTPYDASNPNGYITSATLDGFFPLSGGEVIGNVYFGTESSAINRTGDASRFPSHFYRNVYSNNGQVYDHYYNPKYTASQYTYANLRVKDGSGFRTLYFGGDGQFKWGPYNVWHAGNFNPANYLPLSGGTLTASGFGNALCITRQETGSSSVIKFADSSQLLGYIGIGGTDHALAGHPMVTLNYIDYKLWHEGNDGAGSGLDADLWDGMQYEYGINDYGNNRPYFRLFSITVKGSWASGVTSFTLKGKSGYICNVSFDVAGTPAVKDHWLRYVNCDNINSYVNKLRVYKIVDSVDNEGNIISIRFEVWITGQTQSYDFVRYWGVRNTPDTKLVFYNTSHDSLPSEYLSYNDAKIASINLPLDIQYTQTVSSDGPIKIHLDAQTQGLRVLNCMCPNMPVGTASSHGMLLYLGVKDSAFNGGYMKYYYNGDGNNTNSLRFGLYGSDNLFNIQANGYIGVNKTNPSCALDINGSLAVSGDIRMKGSGNYGNTLYFGDGSYCYIKESSDDLLNLYASQGIVLNGGIYNGVSFVGNERNDILTEYYENASITNVDIGWPNTSIRHAISFKWYNSKWSIGNIRDGGASSRGWGVAENGTILKFRVDDTVYSYCGLNVTGNILATGGVTMYSQRSLKNVVNERGLSLDELSVIKPTRYTWKDGRDSNIHIGGIADDVKQVLPEVVYKTKEGILTMDYGNAGFAIAASLIKPVVDHEERIKALEIENKLLKQELNRLRA